MVVLAADDKKWDLRQAALDGRLVRVSPPNGSKPNGTDAAWWVCEGDAEQFNPNARIPTKLYTTTSGNISFQGTVGATQIRGTQTTLTLGAAGSVRMADEDLTANSPSTRRVK